MCLLYFIFETLHVCFAAQQFLREGPLIIKRLIIISGSDAVGIFKPAVSIKLFFSKLKSGPDHFSGSHCAFQAYLKFVGSQTDKQIPFLNKIAFLDGKIFDHPGYFGSDSARCNGLSGSYQRDLL